jgi:bifunctional DNA-binding transcriptional regulator/antitoxin component of YhaV-PrlF toxin-antitoxin module
MSAATSRLTAQGQTSVPAEVRRHLGLGAGAVLEWEFGEGVVTVRRRGRYSFEDIHRKLFPDGPPKPLSVEQMDEAIRSRMRRKLARG